MMVLNIASQFSQVLGPRFREEGDFSGQQFREEWLTPKFLEDCRSEDRFFIDLDGGRGYATAFLEQAVGGFARKFGSKVVLDVLICKTDEEPYLESDTKRYIDEANG